MKILDIKQGSDEWLAARLDYLCASEAPVMMGASPYMSRRQLLDAKKGWQANPHAKFKQRLFKDGHEHEASARVITEIEFLREIAPAVGVREVDGLSLAASFDGFSAGDDGVMVWEHKDWNAILAENVRNLVLDPLYYWQLEHQALVADVGEVLLTVSDGTAEKRISMPYKSDPERRADLISGWRQFVVDLDGHTIEAKKEMVASRGGIEVLPDIKVKVDGNLVISNISDFLPAIRDLAMEEISRKLESDKDFAEKEALNKSVKKARAKLKEVVSGVESQMVSYNSFSSVAAEIDAILQKMQAHGERQVKGRKADIKREIISKAQSSIMDHIKECEKLIEPFKVNNIFYPNGLTADFDAAMKNKRSIDAWVNAADSEAANVKAIISRKIDAVAVNVTYFKGSCSGYEMVFRDIEKLLDQPSESFKALVDQRISEFLIKKNEPKGGAQPKSVQPDIEVENNPARECEEIMISVLIQVPKSKLGKLTSLVVNEFDAEIISEKSLIIK